MRNIPRNTCPKDNIINDVIALEWEMFQQVQNIGGRAPCQDQYNTFYANRYSQHSILQEDTVASYRQDLIDAKAAGRNLVTEKYAYMMEFTEPAYYGANLKQHLPVLETGKAELIARIVSCQLIGYQKYAEKHPVMARAGRPSQEGLGDTSIRQYSIGEYKTYSDRTLSLILRDVISIDNPVLEVESTLVTFYGFDSIEAAEKAQAFQF